MPESYRKVSRKTSTLAPGITPNIVYTKLIQAAQAKHSDEADEANYIPYYNPHFSDRCIVM